MRSSSGCVLVYSGGLDSTVLLYQLAHLKGAENVAAISFNYGQRHKKELECAKFNTLKLGVRHNVVDLSSLKSLLQGSSLTDDTVATPHGHYAVDNMKATVVPNRNMIMLSIAAGWAMSLGYEDVVIASHAGDHFIYPDCRPEFNARVDAVLQVAHFTPVRLRAPFAEITKACIVDLGGVLNVPFEHAWSCYEGGEVACGLCGTCVERIEAFIQCGKRDPMRYQRPWEVCVENVEAIKK